MKKILIVLLIVILLALLIAGGYLAYLFIDYHRIEDEQNLTCVERSEDALESGTEQTIVTWNLGFGAYNDDFSFFMDGGTESRSRSKEICEGNINAAIEALKAQNADLILLQEVDVRGTRSRGVNQVEMIESAFMNSHSSVYAQNYDSSYLFYPIKEPIGANQGGILTLADARITEATRFSLPIESGFRKFFDLDRCYSVSRVPVRNGKTLALFNLHLSAYTADGSIATEQLKIMLAHMQTELEAGNYVIAGGDFNKDLWGNSAEITGISGEDYSWAQPFPTELLPAGFSLVDTCDRENPVLSCRDTGAAYEKGATFEVTLDGFILSENVRLVSCAVIDEGFKVSDHNPVMLKFILSE